MYTKIGIACFVLAVMTGPLYSAPGYSPISHLISHLGAQKTGNSFIMIFAFLALGSGIVADSVRSYKKEMLPFLFFGLCIGLAGVFPHRPLDGTMPYNHAVHSLHGLFATLAGISITTGFIWQAMISREKIICTLLALVSFVFPLLMLRFENIQGVIQRTMYLIVFVWFWYRYPLQDSDRKLP